MESEAGAGGAKTQGEIGCGPTAAAGNCPVQGVKRTGCSISMWCCVAGSDSSASSSISSCSTGTISSSGSSWFKKRARWRREGGVAGMRRVGCDADGVSLRATCTHLVLRRRRPPLRRVLGRDGLPFAHGANVQEAFKNAAAATLCYRVGLEPFTAADAFESCEGLV